MIKCFLDVNAWIISVPSQNLWEVKLILLLHIIQIKELRRKNPTSFKGESSSFKEISQNYLILFCMFSSLPSWPPDFLRDNCICAKMIIFWDVQNL